MSSKIYKPLRFSHETRVLIPVQLIISTTSTPINDLTYKLKRKPILNVFLTS